MHEKLSIALGKRGQKSAHIALLNVNIAHIQTDVVSECIWYEGGEFEILSCRQDKTNKGYKDEKQKNKNITTRIVTKRKSRKNRTKEKQETEKYPLRIDRFMKQFCSSFQYQKATEHF